MTLEVVNVGQAYFLSTDLQLYDEALDSPCSVRSSNLVQELGMVRNIFSDKTGTLTRNEMKFVKFIVDGRIYDVEPITITGRGSEFESPAAVSLREHATKSPLYNFIECLCLCHTIIRERDGTYRSESPVELALVEGVGKFKCGLAERASTTMIIDMIGEKKVFEILAVNAFNSDRKRMSILVRDIVKDQYILLVKGADNPLLDLCKLNPTVRSQVDVNLLNFACEGLRTLCVARKILPAQDALRWLVEWKAAASALRDRKERLDEVAATIEVELDLLGITAIEDRLQDQVPETIADLTKAGIIVWMLTGDKEETAINIGHSCNLLREDTTTHTLTKIKSAEEFHEKLVSIHDSILIARENPTIKVELALVLDGPSFTFFDETSSLQRSCFLKIGQSCRCVIGCRLTPIQKQQLVHIVKMDSVPRSITLSIGDGANDVSMIREADVGVGIIGKEGRQAANSADFAIGQFKFLRRMLLVHGRWNYLRQSKVFLYSMHKNMVLTLTLFWFRYVYTDRQMLYRMVRCLE